MGSIITLGIENFEIDWGKNGISRNHSVLFLPDDIRETKYYYAESVVEIKPAFSRKLKDVVKRVELLGYSLQKIEEMYNQSIDEVPDYYDPVTIGFEDFHRIISTINISKIRLDKDYVDGAYDLGEFVTDCIFKDGQFRKFKKLRNLDRDIGTFFENLDPYIVLRLLYENEENRELDIIWRYHDLVESGWVRESDIYDPLPTKDKFLLVTEGSTDSFIIKRAFEIIYPEIADFFYYVDMKENYPFTGTGNLFKFCQGLVSINILNKVLFIYDNDVAGNSKFIQSKTLKLPSNVGIMKLPDMNEFTRFSCLGPNGLGFEDINGKAVSIECFLDLGYKASSEPQVRWKSFDEQSNHYQGELVHKDKYTRIFQKAKNQHIYDLTKLTKLLDCIYDHCLRL